MRVLLALDDDDGASEVHLSLELVSWSVNHRHRCTDLSCPPVPPSRTKLRPRRAPVEGGKLLLVLGRQGRVDGRERRLLARELFVKVGRVGRRGLRAGEREGEGERERRRERGGSAHARTSTTTARRERERESERTHDGRVERTRDALVEDVVPVRVLEEEVRLDLGGVGLARAESASRVLGEELRVQRVDSRVGEKSESSKGGGERAREMRDEEEGRSERRGAASRTRARGDVEVGREG